MVSNSRDPLDTLLEEKKYFQFVLSSMEERKRKAACTLQSQVKAEKLTRYECVYIFTTICLIFGTYSTCGYFDRNQNESAPTSIDTTSLLPDFIVMRLGFNSMEGLGVSFLTLLSLFDMHLNVSHWWDFIPSFKGGHRHRYHHHGNESAIHRVTKVHSDRRTVHANTQEESLLSS